MKKIANKITKIVNEQFKMETCKYPVTAISIGAGLRGRVYSKYALLYPDKFKILAVADPKPLAREFMQKTFDIKDSFVFLNWETLCNVEKFADCAIICTQDQNHVGPAVAFAEKGYNILLEKPMSVTADECKKIFKTCRKNDVMLGICYVLRYHPSVRKLKSLIEGDLIGEVVHVQHTEPTGYWHFAHSYVRGNWAKESTSSFSLLAKCTHDIDFIYYLMSNHKCLKVSSFGGLQHFRKENKPKNGGSRCLECPVESTCVYSAKKTYLDPKPDRARFPMNGLCDIEETGSIYFNELKKAVETGPYGKCAYDADNDVCDHQVVHFQFDNGATVALTMIAYTKEVCEPKTIIYGTKGQLEWDDFFNYTIRHYDFLTDTHRVIECEEVNPGWDHGGADFYIIDSFVRAVSTDDDSYRTTEPLASVNSHLLCFAAEHSRKCGEVVDTTSPKWRMEL
ncbi:UNVERIFIED_CONTAM: hypothetical protein RMT77_008632 [Armadillidium vulgare]